MKYKLEINHLLEAVSFGYCGVVFRKYNKEFPKRDKGKRAAFYRESKKLLAAIRKMLAAKAAIEGNVVILPEDKKTQIIAEINKKMRFYSENGLNIAINGLPREIYLESKDLSIDGVDIYMRDKNKEGGLAPVLVEDEINSLECMSYDLAVKLEKLERRGETPIKRSGRKMKTGGGYKMPAKDNKGIDFSGKAVHNENVIAGNALKAMFSNYADRDISLILNEI